MVLQPVRLEPHFVPRIWGARSLAPLFPEKNSLTEPIGEAWLTGDDCRFADGPFRGERLRDAWPRMGEEWTGRLAGRHRNKFPILAKFLFPEDRLSVQVHPDDDYASRHEAAAGGTGKTEMWYVVSARAGAEVRVGLKPAVTKESFQRAIADDTAEEMLERIPVAAGDAIFVPAGTVHTIGSGMILCEVQQNSDITYRVYDFGRIDAQGKLRELHVEKALDVIRFGKRDGGKVLPALQQQERDKGIFLVECPYFRAVKQEFEEAGAIHSGRFELVIVVHGSGTINTKPGITLEYSQGQMWLVPCALQETSFVPREPTTILRVSAPAL